MNSVQEQINSLRKVLNRYNHEYYVLDNLSISSVKTINKEKISDYISSTINDVHFWKSCLILSLLFFGIEIALLKLIKT